MPQWYETNQSLLKIEIKAMGEFWPDARYGYLADGRMFWSIPIRPIVNGHRKEWNVLAVYSAEFPSKSIDSIKVYPATPNYEDMLQMVTDSGFLPAEVPHVFQDNAQNICFDLSSPVDINKDYIAGESVVSVAARVSRWIYLFEQGLLDKRIWKLFCGSPNNRGDTNE